MALIRWRHLDPWGQASWDLGRLQREMNRLFEGVWPGYREDPIEFPAVNVWTRGDDVIVAAELPGMKPEEVDLTITNKVLTIKGERKPLDGGKEGAYHRRERKFGPFARSIELPEKVDAEKATASCEHGILTVTLPKSAEAKARQITVKG